MLHPGSRMQPNAHALVHSVHRAGGTISGSMCICAAWWQGRSRVLNCSKSQRPVHFGGVGGLCVAGPFAVSGHVHTHFGSETELLLLVERFLRWVSVWTHVSMYMGSVPSVALCMPGARPPTWRDGSLVLCRAASRQPCKARGFVGCPVRMCQRVLTMQCTPEWGHSTVATAGSMGPNTTPRTIIPTC